jgi:hypothetical protein
VPGKAKEGGLLRRSSAFAAAVVTAIVAVGMTVGSLAAQTAGGPADEVYGACGRDEARIEAAALPRVVDQARCPVGGRQIVDRGVAVVVPGPGESVFAEVMSPGGNQQLVVANPVGGKLVVERADAADGRRAALRGPEGATPRASGPSACRDSYRNPWSSRLNNYIRWYFNRGSTPSYLPDRGVVRAMQRAGTNVSAVRDGCGIGDSVPAVLKYQGTTGSSVDMSRSGACGNNDHKSVVGFGDLSSGFTGSTCIWSWIQDGPDRINSSDVRLNKADYAWTTRVTSGCRGRYDVESTMTHERGHTFGLGDVSEGSHGNLTMSSGSNGPCQTSERSLGRGDAVGLNEKY